MIIIIILAREGPHFDITCEKREEVKKQGKKEKEGHTQLQ